MDLFFLRPSHPVSFFGGGGFDRRTCSTKQCQHPNKQNQQKTTKNSNNGNRNNRMAKIQPQPLTTTPVVVTTGTMPKPLPTPTLLPTGCGKQQQEHATTAQNDTDAVTDGSGDVVVVGLGAAESETPAAKTPAAVADAPPPPMAPTTTTTSNDNDHNKWWSHPTYYGSFDGEFADELVAKTDLRVEHNIGKSTYLQNHRHVLEEQEPVDDDDDDETQNNDNIPTFSIGDIDAVRGELVGSGGFASVYAILPQDNDDNQQEDNSSSNNNTVHQKLQQHEKQQQQYVVKHLSAKLLESSSTATIRPTTTSISKRNKKLFMGAKDIVLEAHFLAALDHPNILKLQGCSRGGISSFAIHGRTDAYFMVLPRLSCTLSDKIVAWRTEQQQHHHHCGHFSGGSSVCSNGSTTTTTASITSTTTGRCSTNWVMRSLEKRRQKREDRDAQQYHENYLFCERLQIMVDLLSALEYLHDRRIMHRDIKPPNVGFDRDGCLKLFDFGLAKELPKDSDVYAGECRQPLVTAQRVRQQQQQRHHQQSLGNTGTPRYMAPEIIRREAYDCKVDVFATSILCWEVLTQKKPYGADVSGQYVKECVGMYGDRPAPLPRDWPKALRTLIRQGWTQSAPKRPTSQQMRVAMERILQRQQSHLEIDV